MEVDADVVVAGDGPAGAVAALTLARAGATVTLVGGRPPARPRPGETLAPAARPVLARLGLLDVATTTSTPSFGNQSAWGGPDLDTLAFVFNPHGAGWHLDRCRFDSLVVAEAVAAGARWASGIRVTACRAGPGATWRVALSSNGLIRETTTRGLIDATGRRAALACFLGARRTVQDRLLGLGVHYRGDPQVGGPTMVEATPEGWWYSAPVPPDRFVVMLMTDADLCRAGRYASRSGWDAALAATTHTRRRLQGCEPLPGRPHLAPASSHRLVRQGVPGRWLAAGDAALAVDPLSGTGILAALATGEAAGLAMAAWLDGHPEPAHAYERWLDARAARYAALRRAYYAVEGRWLAAPFWCRRRVPAA